MAITWCELDEGFRNASCHGGAYTIPPCWPKRRRGGAPWRRYCALALAYEVTTRFALAFPFPVFNVHPHAAFATIGAAATSSCAATMRRRCWTSPGGKRVSLGPFDTAVEIPGAQWLDSAGAWIAACRTGRSRYRRAASTPMACSSDVTRREPFRMRWSRTGHLWSVANGYLNIRVLRLRAFRREATLELLGAWSSARWTKSPRSWLRPARWPGAGR